MKYTNLRAFEKHVQEASPNHFACVYLILGKEDFARKTATDILVRALFQGLSHPELAQKVFNAQQTEIQELIAELNTFNFLTPRKVLLVQQVDKWVKADHDLLNPFFAKPLPGTTLVFSGAALAANTLLFKKLEKAGIVLDLPEEKAWEKEKSMQAWVLEQAAKANKKLDAATAQQLIKRVGTDAATLHQELEKLICYVGERPIITAQDTAKLSSSIPSDTIWQLGEALFRRDTPTALRISKGLLAEGTAFLSLLRQIRSQFQTDYQISCILAEGGGAVEIAQHYPYMKGPILDKHIQAAISYGKLKFREGLLALDDTELKVKNSAADEDLLNELLILKLTSP